MLKREMPRLGLLLGGSIFIHWGIEMELFPEGCQFLPINLHGLLNMCLVSLTQKMIPLFSMFQHGS